MSIPTDSAHITPEWLTSVLKSAGCLPQGAVLTVDADSFETPPSFAAHLRLKFSEDAPPDVPRRVFMKLSKCHKLTSAQREFRFYDGVAPIMGDVPLVRCYAAVQSPEDGRICLLLQDVSETHLPIDGIPTTSQMEAILNATAKLHAVWWNRPDLVEMVGESAEQSYSSDFDGNDRRYAELLQRFGDRIPEKLRRIYERAFQTVPSLIIERIRSGRHLTFCRPDSHPGNYLVQRDAAKRPGFGPPAYLIDWHRYCVSWGPRDLTKLFSSSIAQNEAWQTTLLHFYHRKLKEYGVSGYEWLDLWSDYRLAVLDNLFQPLGNRNQPWVWAELESAIYMFAACQCVELLGAG
jgi:hypothetical protein